MFGISTSWLSRNAKTGYEILDKYEAIGAPGMEIEYRVSSEIFNQIKEDIKYRPIKILSLHNYCPHPEILPIEQASGDAFSLASSDPDERKLAVQYSLRTLQNAHELEAIAAVFHFGAVEMDRERDRWFELLERDQFLTEEGQAFKQLKLKQREDTKQKNIDAIYRSLETLNKEAEKLNIRIGMENRYYWDDIPSFEEIGTILSDFAGSNIGYWHDVGHGQTHDAFGLCKHEDFLKAYSNYLVGFHLHDAQEVGHNDHFAPGSGLIDYDMIKSYMPDDALRIIEVKIKVTEEELLKGIQFLKNKKII